MGEGGGCMGKLIKKQPALLHVPVKKDIVYTPDWLARGIIWHFAPIGNCLDPCRGDGAFYTRLPGHNRDWCEIEQGRDFYACTKHYDWIVGNPPYSDLLAWIRHSFTIADNIVYLVPVHRVMSSYQFYRDLRKWGGIREVLTIGTGTDAGFPFGHWLGAVYFKKGYYGGTGWSDFNIN